MATEQELETIEISMTQAKEKIMLADALKQLHKNSNFKKLILNKFINEQSIRLVKVKASIGMQDERNQKYIDQQINAIGQFNQFLLHVEQEGRMAESSLMADEQERELMLGEE